MTLITTHYDIILPNGQSSTHTTDWPRDPGYNRIRILTDPILNGGWLEHVLVLWNNKPSDMLVDEEGLLKNLPQNEQATKLYRAAMLSRSPGLRPESLNFIVGPAILFHRRVWF